MSNASIPPISGYGPGCSGISDNDDIKKIAILRRKKGRL